MTELIELLCNADERNRKTYVAVAADAMRVEDVMRWMASQEEMATR